MSDLRKQITFAISDPGNAGEGYKGERSLTEWQVDAVMRVVEAALQAEREKNAKIAETDGVLMNIDWWLEATKKQVSVFTAESIAAAIRKGGE